MNSTLKTVQSSLKARLQQRSGAVREAINSALGATFFLSDCGCTFQGVEIRGEHVVIHIDPPDADRLTGSIHVRRVNGRHIETVYVARVMDCQVQWVIPDEPVQFAQGA